MTPEAGLATAHAHRPGLAMTCSMGSYLCQVGRPSEGRAIHHLAPGFSLHADSLASGFGEPHGCAPDGMKRVLFAVEKLIRR